MGCRMVQEKTGQLGKIRSITGQKSESVGLYLKGNVESLLSGQSVMSKYTQ